MEKRGQRTGRLQPSRHGRGIDAAEKSAFQKLHAQQNSLGGRITGLFKGRGYQERQREELAERFEAQRIKQHPPPRSGCGA